jgi:hypothetical protein
MTNYQTLADELENEFPAVDVTTVVFSGGFAGVGCCVIPQDKVIEVVAALRTAQPHPSPDKLAGEIKTIKSFINEVAGVWDAFDHGIRAEISNTNYAVVYEKLTAAEAALDRLRSPSPQAAPVAWRNSCVLIRNAVVMAIAFLGRDAGTSRAQVTTPQIIEALSNADKEVRWLIDHAAPPSAPDGEVAVVLTECRAEIQRQADKSSEPSHSIFLRLVARIDALIERLAAGRVSVETGDDR